MKNSTRLNPNDPAQFKIDIIRIASTILKSIMSDTVVEDAADTLFDIKIDDKNPNDPNRELLKLNILFLKTTPLKDMSFVALTDDPSKFIIKNTQNNQTVKCSNRAPTNNELRASILKNTLEKEKKTNPDKTIYDTISNRLHDPKHSELSVYSKNILANMYAQENTKLKKIINDGLDRFIQLSIKNYKDHKKTNAHFSIENINFDEIYDRTWNSRWAQFKKKLPEGWSKFKKNWRAGSVFSNKPGQGLDPYNFDGNLFAPMVAAALLPLQVALYPALRESEKKSLLGKALGAIGYLTYTVAATACMIAFVIPAEAINVLAAATLAVIKKEPLKDNFYAEYGRFGEEGNNGKIYNAGLAVGHFVWNIPSKIYSLFKKKETPKVPVSQEAQQEMRQQPAYNHFKATHPNTEVLSVSWHGAPAMATQGPLQQEATKKGIYFGHKKGTDVKRNKLREELMESCLLFLHQQATNPNRDTSKPINLKPVQKTINKHSAELLQLKSEVLSEAIVAYNQEVNPDVQFTIKGKRPNAALSVLPSTIDFCEKLKEPRRSPSPSPSI